MSENRRDVRDPPTSEWYGTLAETGGFPAFLDRLLANGGGDAAIPTDTLRRFEPDPYLRREMILRAATARKLTVYTRMGGTVTLFMRTARLDSDISLPAS